MRIDAHHHFWTPGRYVYPWLGPHVAAIHREFSPRDLQPLLREKRIDRTVLVQTISSLDETKWFLTLAREHPFIAGVVGWVDLQDPKVGATLDELRAGPGLVGIRHNVHDELDVRWLRRPEVLRGLEELARRRLPYDLLIRPPHLEAALATVRAMPQLPFVVDHIAKPRIAARGWEDWVDGIRALAACPNVWCKLSGMITEADWDRWQPADLQPYIQEVIAAFGPERLMFGSDWPVCLLAGSYARVVEALEMNLAHLGARERAGIFGGNAIRFYGLSEAAR